MKDDERCLKSIGKEEKTNASKQEYARIRTEQEQNGFLKRSRRDDCAIYLTSAPGFCPQSLGAPELIAVLPSFPVGTAAVRCVMMCDYV